MPASPPANWVAGALFTGRLAGGSRRKPSSRPQHCRRRRRGFPPYSYIRPSITTSPPPDSSSASVQDAAGPADSIPQENLGPSSRRAPLISPRGSQCQWAAIPSRRDKHDGPPGPSGQGITVDHEEKHGESDAPLIPRWAAEHKYLFLTAEVLLLIVLAVVGASHGPVETFLLEAAALSVQAVAWRWGYQRRRASHWQGATTAIYVDREMAAADLMEGSRRREGSR
jgi:hypothetical protein